MTAPDHPAAPSSDVQSEQPSAAPGKAAVSSLGRGIAGAAFIVSLDNIASRLLGLLRENRNAYFFGASGSMSAFAVASLIPKNIYELLVGGMVSAALVPVLSEYAEHRQKEELWHLISVILSTVVVVMGGMLLLAELAAPLFTRVLVTGFGPELQQLTTLLIRIISPAILFFGISGVLTAVLYARQVFAYAAVGAAVFNLGSVLSTQLLARRIDISSLTLGVVIGAFLQMLVQLPGLRSTRIRFVLDWNHPALRRITRLYIPVLFSLVVSQIGIIIDRNLASRVGEQAIAWMESATRMREFPLGLVSTAVSMAILPTLSRLNLDTDRQNFAHTLGLGLRLVLLLIIPATVGLMILGRPLISLLFEHGEFTALDSSQATLALMGYMLGTPFSAVDLLLIFAFYAQKDTVTPVLVGILSVFIYLGVAPLFAFYLGWGMMGLVLANSLQLTSHAFIMLDLMHRRLGNLHEEHLASTTVRIIVASIAMAICTYLSFLGLRSLLPSPGMLSLALCTALSATVGVLVYAAFVLRLHLPEAHMILQLVQRRLR